MVINIPGVDVKRGEVVTPYMVGFQCIMQAPAQSSLAFLGSPSVAADFEHNWNFVGCRFRNTGTTAAKATEAAQLK